MTLADVAVELYALPPAEFTAARNARARSLRGDGDRDLARQVAALRRPTQAAWAVNLLVRRRPDDVERLLALGARLLRAQTDRAGDRLRDLDREQHARMAALRAEARRLAADAGQRLGEGVDVPLESTLRAAMTDDDAAAAVRSGLLVADLQSTGFGPVEVGDAVAVPGAPPLTTPAAAVLDPPARPDGAADAAGSAQRSPEDDDAAAAIALPRPRTSQRARSGAAPGRGARPRSPRVRVEDRGGERRPADPEQGPTGREARVDDRAARAARERAASTAALERERAVGALREAEARAASAAAALADAESAVELAREERAAAGAEVERLAAALAEARGRSEAAEAAERRTTARRDAAAATADTEGRRVRAARDRLDGLG